MAEDKPLVRASLRFYRVLLLAYPREFREEYGPHMEQVFRELCRDEIGTGGIWGYLGFWIRILLDVAATTLTEKCFTRRDPGGAALLSFLWPGTGQLYNRQLARGIPCVLFGLLWWFAWIGVPESLGKLEHFASLTVALVAIQIWSMVDAYERAELINASVVDER